MTGPNANPLPHAGQATAREEALSQPAPPPDAAANRPHPFLVYGWVLAALTIIFGLAYVACLRPEARPPMTYRAQTTDAEATVPARSGPDRAPAVVFDRDKKVSQVFVEPKKEEARKAKEPDTGPPPKPATADVPPNELPSVAPPSPVEAPPATDPRRRYNRLVPEEVSVWHKDAVTRADILAKGYENLPEEQQAWCVRRCMWEMELLLRLNRAAHAKLIARSPRGCLNAKARFAANTERLGQALAELRTGSPKRGDIQPYLQLTEDVAEFLVRLGVTLPDVGEMQDPRQAGSAGGLPTVPASPGGLGGGVR